MQLAILLGRGAFALLDIYVDFDTEQNTREGKKKKRESCVKFPLQLTITCPPYPNRNMRITQRFHGNIIIT